VRPGSVSADAKEHGQPSRCNYQHLLRCGQTGLESTGTGTYSASKFAVLALTQALADEGKTDDIKAVAICPALVATPMTGVSGPDYLQPEDVAETVLYLLRVSPAAWPTEIILERKGAD
jgi:NAD(P)-dependent dehydrogenase (short-subunit alcohol dehydrogenase family)